ncbi:MAG: recombinase family protein [Agrobacterium cavarae]|uniref:recombinase family protein n=1 Tax=Agrobacterium cavarae TaxID=2528239 RepID=UPI0031AED822
MARIGYARVSALDQDLEIQQHRLTAEGCQIIRCEKVSGASREGRTELATIMEFLREGDELIVTRLDRLGRDTRDVLNIVHECEVRGAFVTVLEPHVSTKGEMGKVILTVLGMVAQMERRFIKDRQRDGITRAKKAGIYKGGKPRLNHKQIILTHSCGISVASILQQLNCSRMQVYRVLSTKQLHDATGEKVR